MSSKAWVLALVGLAVGGCGASYEITRTAPDGTTLKAVARTAEKAGAISFSFDGDPAGQMKITLDKENTEPVNMTNEALQTILGLAGGSYAQ